MDRKDNAVGFDYPNDVKPKNYNQINRKHLHVPAHANHTEKKASSHEIMRAVREAK